MASASPAGVVTSSRQEVLESIGLGRSSRSERSRREEPKRGDSPPRPLARDLSVGRSIRKDRSSHPRHEGGPQVRGPPEVRSSEVTYASASAEVERCIGWHGGSQIALAGLHARATAGAVRGVRKIRDRARGSCRLQKSTGGARPFAPPGEEPGGSSFGSSSLARERRGSEEAPEAGPSVAKPRDRWRAPSRGSTCRGKALRAGKADRVDARWVEAALASRIARVTGRVAARQGASKIRSPDVRAVENAAARTRRKRRRVHL